ncbi:ATP-binding protein [Aeribacillus sp. FSL M8-0254]
MAEYAATLNMPYSEFLFRLLEAEIVKRQERSIQTLIKVQTAVSQDDRYV